MYTGAELTFLPQRVLEPLSVVSSFGKSFFGRVVSQNTLEKEYYS